MLMKKIQKQLQPIFINHFPMAFLVCVSCLTLISFFKPVASMQKQLVVHSKYFPEVCPE